MVVLHKFLVLVENQFGVCTKVIRSDNGGEFLSSDCRRIFANNGILHHQFVLYIPQQNGQVEKKHRPLIETSRVIHLYSGLPKLF